MNVILNKTFAVLICLVLIMGLASPALAAENGESRTVIDMGGKAVALPERIERVASASTQAADMMLAFGAGDKLIATHKSVFFNPWFAEFCPNSEELTVLDAYEVEAESAYAINADLVFAPDPNVCQSLRDKGICAVCFRTYSTEEVMRAAEMLGEIFGGEVKEKADAWLSDWQQAIDTVAEKLRNIPMEERPVVYEIIGSSYKGLFRTDYGDAQGWLQYGGGQIATLPFAGATWNNMPTEEAILATDPDVILINGTYWSRLKEDLDNDVRWSTISAVKSGQVYNVPIGCTSWSNFCTGYPLMIYYTFSVLYPDLTDFSMAEMADAFYQKYYGINFTDQQINYMLQGLAPDGGSLCD